MPDRYKRQIPLHSISNWIPIFVWLLFSLPLSGCWFFSAKKPAVAPIEAKPVEPIAESCADLLSQAEESSSDDASMAHIHTAIASYERMLTTCVRAPGGLEKGEIQFRLVRLYFMAGETVEDSSEKMRWIVKGEGLSDELMKSHPVRVEGYYYAALLKGRRAQLSGLGFGAMALTHQVEEIGLKAAELDPKFENGGPLRFLAMLYAKAPPWPTSVGDMDLAYEYSDKALAIVDYPLNHLIRAEVLIEDREYAAAREELEITLSAPRTGQWAREGEKWRVYVNTLMKKIEKL